MNYALDIWRTLAGIAVFLLGMNFLEDGLKQLAGRRFKLFLRKQSGKKLSALGSAAVVTGVLQSSSVVNLMILALAGASIINMQHALALMLGTNLGTTLSTWFVAAVGFKLNMESFALPVIGITGICRALIKKNSTGYHWNSFCLGLGFVFAGLDWMKTGIGNAVSNIDLSTLQQYPAIIFLLIGICITGLIQSSSATIAIVLSALHAHAITLYSATAITLGAEIGTTLKLILASAGGSPIKKRVATGNFLFNSISALIFLVLLGPVNKMITDIIGIKDPLIALSFFQTFINFTGILLFFPFLNTLGRFLERLFVNEKSRSKYIDAVPVTDADLALAALRKESLFFIRHVACFSLKIFELEESKLLLWNDLPERYREMPEMDQYDYLKQLHGDIYTYCIRLQKSAVTQHETVELTQLTASVRNAMYAAKSIKDAFYDIGQLKNSGNESKYAFYIQSREKTKVFYDRLAGVLQKDNRLSFEEMVSIYQSVQSNYTASLSELYKEDNNRRLSDLEVSTIINFNRELYASFKSMALALKDCLLTEKDAVYFDDLPGFIH